MEPIVTTVYGRISGVEDSNSYVYKGIPYAKPPVEELRFKAPQRLEKWEGIYKADSFKTMSVQMGEKPSSFYGKEFFSLKDFPVPEKSEDCLYLNVWTPKEKGKYPVAIWYHGGGFVGGYSFEPEFDGDDFASKGIILVTVSYRLGMLGTFCHPSLRDENGISGNYGFRDMIAAIDWVKENIASFNGDPEDITIFGQSAGGMAIRTLVTSPCVKGKIKKAIIQSCNGYKGPLKVDFTMEEMEKIGERFLKLKRLNIEKLKQITDIDKLIRLQSEYNLYCSFKTHASLNFNPTVDGKYLPVSPDTALEKDEVAKVNYMVGCMKDDIGSSKESKTDPNKSTILKSLMNWAMMNNEHGNDSYCYYFAHDLPGDDSGAFHSGELWYVFHTLDRSWRPFNEYDHQLADRVSDIWASFIKRGDPGWERCTKENSYYETID